MSCNCLWLFYRKQVWPGVTAAGVVWGRMHARRKERCAGCVRDLGQTLPQHRGSFWADGSGTHSKTRWHRPSGQPIGFTQSVFALRFSSSWRRRTSREEVMWLLIDSWHFCQVWSKITETDFGETGGKSVGSTVHLDQKIRGHGFLLIQSCHITYQQFLDQTQ